MSEIAIFSTSLDEPTYGPVVERLDSRGYSAWVYNSDKIATGEDSLSVCIDNGSEILLNYNDLEYRLSSLRSAWFRHPNIFNLSLEDKAKQFCVEQEISSLQESFWSQVPEDSWMNHPGKMKTAQVKLAQLTLAHELGFKTPKTVVSNRWSEIEKTLDYEEIIVKMSKGLIYEDNQEKVLYTTVLGRDKRDELKSNSSFPAIYQERIPKQKEWRVTIVGDDAFEAAIYTSDDAQDDWRRHQLTSKVQFKRESLPDAEVQRCIDFLKHFGLEYGAFDFIEDEEGEITFLECNTNGQYKWIEEVLGMPISEAITDILIKNHNSN